MVFESQLKHVIECGNFELLLNALTVRAMVHLVLLGQA